MCLVFNIVNALGQVKVDSLNIPSSVKSSPNGALLRSALMPGWGQWYNKQKLKALLVFGGELAIIGNIVYYNQMAVKSVSSIERDFYKENRNRYYWWLFGIYLLNLLDAYIDAHLIDFDTGPDLSANLDLTERNIFFLNIRFVFDSKDYLIF
jgi:hypothetical protein